MCHCQTYKQIERKSFLKRYTNIKPLGKCDKCGNSILTEKQMINFEENKENIKNLLHNKIKYDTITNETYEQSQNK